MRLRRFGLARYGRFTDFAIDFRPPPSDGPDLHLIYGANEAGKSTILSGLIEFLFGMHRETPYNFLHAYDAMRLDAEIEQAGAIMSLTRIKKPRNSLLNADGAVTPESVFGPLADLGQAGYVAMFSLDDASLKAGAADLLAAKGDFGEILFGASTGLAHVSETLAAMRAEADAIHRPRAHASEIQELRRQIDALAERRASADVSASRFEDLKAARDRAAKAAAEANRAERAAREGLARLERLETGLAAFEKLQAGRRTLSALPDLPAAKPGWPERAAELAQSEKAVEARLADAVAALAELRSEGERIAPDSTVLAAADRIEAVRELAARYEGASKDLPGRREEAATAAAEVREIAGRLGASDIAPEDLLIATPKAAQLDGLISAWTERTERLRIATAAARAQEDSGGDAHALSPAARARLKAAVDRAAASDAAAAAAAASRRAAHLDRDLAAAVTALAPWRGDLDALAGLAIPSDETLAGWRDARNRHRDASAALDANGRQLRERGRQIARDRAAALGRESGDVLDDPDFAALMDDRAAAWRAHLDALDAASAAAFAERMGAVDAAAAARLQAADTIARLKRLDGEAAAVAADLVGVAEDRTAADAAWRATAVEVAAALDRLGLPADLPLDDLARWVAARADAMEIAAEGERERAQLEEFRRRGEEIETELRAALAAADVATENTATVAVLQELAFDRLQRAALGEKQAGDLRRTQTEAAEAAAALAAWRDDWRAAIGGTWLTRFEDDPAAARKALAEAAELRAAMRGLEGFRRQVEGMQRDVDAFAARMAGFAEDFDVSPTAPPAVVWRMLTDRLAEARNDAARSRELADKIEAAATAAADRRRAFEGHRTDVAEMAAHFGVDALAGVLQALATLERRRSAERDVADAATAVRRAADADDLEAAEAALAALTPDSLDAEIGQRREAVEALAAAARDADHAARLAEATVAEIAGDADAVKIEQARQTALIEIAEAAKRHLRLKLGALAVERALDRYRQAHRSGMLDRASEVFARITRGSFSGLATQPGDGRETLVALRPSGASAMDDKAMSTATRAQLYLALRVAGYHEFARRAPPPPFVADDIIETFDDDRAAETFAALADMARTGQVIYLTHHAHLIDIARQAAPGVTVHELPNPTSA